MSIFATEGDKRIRLIIVTITILVTIVTIIVTIMTIIVITILRFLSKHNLRQLMLVIIVIRMMIIYVRIDC